MGNPDTGGISAPAERSSFAGKIGFVMAAAGSAVGLGNIWRFPYLASSYGGGVFLLLYIIMCVTFGATIMIAEIAIGRKTGSSPILAFAKLNKKYTWLGYFTSLISLVILPTYCIIGGWVLKYIVVFCTGQTLAAASSRYFIDFSSQIWEPLIYFLIFVFLSAFVIMFGVNKGIEKISKIMMPILAVLCVALAVYSVQLPGALPGVQFYFVPDFSQLSAKGILMALGQVFYSLSLAVGVMITFGSYLKKDVSITSSVVQVEGFSVGIAILCGLMVIPSVFAFSRGSRDALTSGSSLLFVTMPKVFATMPGRNIFGAIFFIMVFFAAFTSSISMVEVIVAMFMDRFHIGRKTACLIVMGIALLLGIPGLLGNSIWSDVKIFGFSIMNALDAFASNILLPFAALFTCIFVGFVIKPKAIVDEVEEHGFHFKLKKAFSFSIRFIAPLCILAIIVISFVD